MALLLVSSSAGAQGPLTDQRAEAEVTLVPAGENFTFSEDVSSAPEGMVDLDCRGGGFTPLSQGFLFLSEEGRAACGEAVWRLHVPVEAPILRVSFSADRRIGSSAGMDQVEVVQEFTVTDQRGRLLSHQELFPPFNGSEGDTPFEVAVALTPDVREVSLLWRMEDEGSRVPDASMTVPVGAEFHAEVTHVRAVFKDVHVPGVQVVDHEEERQEDQIVRARDVRFQVPAVWSSQDAREVEVQVRLEVRGGYEPVGLVLPGGRMVSVDSLLFGSEEGESEDSVAMVVPGPLLGAGGTGTYTLLLAAQTPAETFVPGGSLMGLLLIFLPAVSLVMAGRALSGHRRPGGGAYRVLRHGVPVVALVLVSSGVVWIQAQGGVGLLTTQAFAKEAWWLYGVLALVFVGSIVVLVVEHKYSHRLRARDWLKTHAELVRERKQREEAEGALYAVVHDLKSPLLVLDHLVQDASSETADAQERRGSLERSRTVLAQAQNMLQDVLDYAVHTGDASKGGKVWIRPVVDQVIQTLRHSAARENLRLVVEGRVDACLNCSSEALHSVLANLLCNAKKYSSQDDSLVRVFVGARGSRKKRSLVLEVADNGPGVPQADRERVFDFLTRLPDRKGRNVPGTGVGLAVVKRVVEEQGGKVEVDDAPEGGALFRVVWPPDRVVRWRRLESPKHKSQARIHQSRGTAEPGQGLSRWVEGARLDPSVTGVA